MNTLKYIHTCLCNVIGTIAIIACSMIGLLVGDTFADESHNFSINEKSGYLAHIKATDNNVSVSIINNENNLTTCSLSLPNGKHSIIMPQEWCGDKLILNIVSDEMTLLYLYDLHTNTIEHFHTINECEDVVVLPGVTDMFTSFYAGFYSNYGLFVVQMSSNKPCHVSDKCNCIPSWDFTGEHLYYTEKTDAGISSIMMFSPSNCTNKRIGYINEDKTSYLLHVSPNEQMLLIKSVEKPLYLMLYDVKDNTIRNISVPVDNGSSLYKLPSFPWSPGNDCIILEKIDTDSKSVSLLVFNVKDNTTRRVFDVGQIDRVLGWMQTSDSIVFTKDDNSIWSLFPATGEVKQILK